jgi:transcriptional regulator with XRE-family HTH domain
MAKKFRTLVSRMPVDAQQRIHDQAQAMLLELNLQELRQLCTKLTQKEVAELLDVTQAYVSKFERREDMLLSTLYAYVHSLGGELELHARLPGRKAVRITQFDHLTDISTLSAQKVDESK